MSAPGPPSGPSEFRTTESPARASRTSAPGSVAATTHLLGRAGQGDRRALEMLCQRYLPRLRRWASGRLPEEVRRLVDTDDVVQEVLYRSVERIGEFENRWEGAFQAYLRQAILNRIRREIRTARRKPVHAEVDEALPDRAASPLEDTVGAEALDRYERGLARLRVSDRELVIARVEMDCSYREIALFLDKPSVDAARVAVGRALVRLAEAMRDEGAE